MWNSDDSSYEEPPQRRRRTFKVRKNFNFESAFKINERFRMPPQKLEEMLEIICPNLESETARNHALTSKQVVCIGLHWMGNGSQYHGLSDMHGVHKSTVCRAVHSFVRTVNNTLFPRVVDWPYDIVKVVKGFHAIAEMPLVIGCIDGTLINMDAPVLNEQQYVDRKNNHSTNCMVVCGPDYTFFYVSARVLRNSTLYHRMEGGWRPIEGGVLLEDSGYPLLDWLMTPTGVNLEDPAVCCVVIYNYAQRAGLIEVVENENEVEDDVEKQNVNVEQFDRDRNVMLQEIINHFRHGQ
ncbi:putative nuclease HARBI1 [Macrosteles quadrilineatus]|uniref:putative nuclease HARBI1 n=1 Tax=Macrosteles quadrilineatus TaxID=74068 RepID=UPI0023E33A64|nr:putative nuclease HARBI1 [Macrosteles quadrilineatus]